MSNTGSIRNVVRCMETILMFPLFSPVKNLHYVVNPPCLLETLKCEFHKVAKRWSHVAIMSAGSMIALQTLRLQTV